MIKIMKNYQISLIFSEILIKIKKPIIINNNILRNLLRKSNHIYLKCYKK